MKTKHILTSIVVIIIVIIIAKGSYVVEEYEQVVITQFGKPVGEAIVEPGLYFMIPFVQKTNFFEKRFMEWNGEPNEATTKEKVLIFISTYARWQIVDPLKFYKRVEDEEGAHSRIDDILDGETKNFIAQSTILEIVRSKNSSFMQQDTASTADSVVIAGSTMFADSAMVVNKGREEIQEQILIAANEEVEDLGIRILDLRFKRINYNETVQKEVFKRMNSDREKIAQKYIAEGKGAAEAIRGQKVNDLDSIKSAAYKTAEMIKGEADARAAAIYAAAYNQSFQAKELYAFMKSMETFEKTFDGKTSIILSTDSELYKFLKKME